MQEAEGCDGILRVVYIGNECYRIKEFRRTFVSARNRAITTDADEESLKGVIIDSIGTTLEFIIALL